MNKMNNFKSIALLLFTQLDLEEENNHIFACEFRPSNNWNAASRDKDDMKKCNNIIILSNQAICKLFPVFWVSAGQCAT